MGPKGGSGGKGMGPRDGSGGRGPRDGSGGRGPRDGSGMRQGSGMRKGSGMMRGSGMKRAMMYCGPKLETEVDTGLEMTVTFYTDEDCTEKLEVPEDRRRLQGKKDE